MATGKRNLIRIPQYIILIYFTVIFLYPIVWLFINSFKTNQELFQSPWTLPSSFNMGNYITAIEIGFGRYFLNSMIISISVVVITTLLSAMAAYGITRLRWKLSGFVLAVISLGIMIPAHATIVPLFSMFNRINFNDTYIAVIIPLFIFSFPIAVLILTGFFSSIPREIEEAAIIDGCSIPGTFFKIIWPMTTPYLVTVAVITFIFAWNDLLFPTIFLSSQDMRTLPVGLTAFQSSQATNYVGMIAAVVITIIPSIIIYIVLHRRIVSGMTAGATKG